MSNVRGVRNTFKVNFSSPFFFSSKLQTLRNSSSYASSASSNRDSFDYIDQFIPSCNPNSNSFKFTNSNERRKIIVGLSKIIKSQKGYVLRGFSHNFCPFFLVKIMKLLESRETAFAFFKVAFCDDSESVIRSSCVAAHILAVDSLRFLAQDIVTWVISRIGVRRSKEFVEIMWSGHHQYESDFSVLDTLMRGFLHVEMPMEAMEILCRMREEGVRPSLSAINILFNLLLRVGDYGSVWKLFRDILGKGPRPCNYTFTALILGFCRKGYVSIGESLFHVMQKYMCVPDIYIYDILINAYCIRGRSSDGLY